MAKHPTFDKRGLTDERTMEVPLEAFALLMAWTSMSSLAVPQHIKDRAAWPAHHDDKKGHLLRALTPAAEKAIALLKAPSPRTSEEG